VKDAIRLNGVTFRRGFSAEVPPPSDDERDRLAESIDEFGVLDPVIVRETAEPATFDVIDGWTRLSVAEDKGVECPYRVERATDDAARKMALDLALARRQLTPERVSELRKKRVERVAAKRAEGKSERAIADEEKISRSQVKRDLGVATGPGGGPVEPKTVTGKDGKVRTAKPKKPRAAKPKPKPDANGKPAEPQPEKDAWGIPIQPHAAGAFAAVPKFRELVAAVRHAQKLFDEVANLEGGKFLTLPEVSSYRRGKKGDDGEHADRFVHPGLETALRQIKNAVPTHTVCPYQYADSPHKPDCPTCRDLNWTPPLSDSIPKVCVKRAKEAHGV
jgi:hypothetical protein